VKARPEYDRTTGLFIKDMPLEVFAFWPVGDYVLPPAVNGKCLKMNVVTSNCTNPKAQPI